MLDRPGGCSGKVNIRGNYLFFIFKCFGHCLSEEETIGLILMIGYLLYVLSCVFRAHELILTFFIFF